MAWFRLGGAGISAALKNAMTAVLNKKLGTSQEYAPNAWPEEVNLLGALEEKTASGSIVTFSDGADDVPLKSCEVTIPPTLSGVSALTVENYGNLCDFDNYNVEANTNTTVSLGADLTLKKGTYTLAFNISDTVTATRNRPCYVVNGNYTYADNDYKTSGRCSWTFTLADDTTLSIRWWAHTVSANITISDFMLTHGSTAHDYEPYQTPTTYTANLGRTIYGGQVDIVNGDGRETWAIIDMGDLTWTYDSTYNRFISSSLPDCIKIDTARTTPILCSAYQVISDGRPLSQVPDKSIYLSFHSSGSSLTDAFVHDSDYTDATAFKTAVTGQKIVYQLKDIAQTDYTFEPVEINSRLGNNTMWSEQGDMSVVYRASGTVTPIQPTLISKSITQNGTYAAADDDADGYSEVTVNVPSQEPTVEPLNSPNAFTTTSGISGTDVERVIRTITAPNDGKYVFASDSTCRTNTGGGDGFIEIRKNDVSVVKQYMAANTTTDITIPDISVEAGDDIDIVGGFDNAHSSCNFQLYTGIAFVSEASVSLLSMSNSNSTNELENELNNLDESEAEQNEELI